MRLIEAQDSLRRKQGGSIRSYQRSEHNLKRNSITSPLLLQFVPAPPTFDPPITQSRRTLTPLLVVGIFCSRGARSNINSPSASSLHPTRSLLDKATGNHQPQSLSSVPISSSTSGLPCIGLSPTATNSSSISGYHPRALQGRRLRIQAASHSAEDTDRRQLLSRWSASPWNGNPRSLLAIRILPFPSISSNLILNSLYLLCTVPYLSSFIHPISLAINSVVPGDQGLSLGNYLRCLVSRLVAVTAAHTGIPSTLASAAVTVTV